MAKPLIFLSYCRENQRQAAVLHQDLVNSGFDVWWDNDILPGEDWKLEVRKAIRRALAVLVCFSRELEQRSGSGVYPEVYEAVQAYREVTPGDIFIIPIRLSECQIPPIEIDATRTLGQLQRVDLFPQTRWADGIKNLILALQRADGKNESPLMALNSIWVAPPPPLLIVGRDEALRELKGRLGGEKRHLLTVVRGWPGVGKTTLAAAFANDPDVVTTFPDGVLWASLGKQPDLISELGSWGRAFGVDDIPKETTVEKASLRLAALLRAKRMLIIIDDVWDPSHAKPLMMGGRECATLITTRLQNVAVTLATPERIYRLDCLDEEASLELMNLLAPNVVKQYREECLEIIRTIEGLPLALRVAGPWLDKAHRRGWEIRKLLKGLLDAAAFLEREVPPELVDLMNETTPTVVALLRKSVDDLDDTTRDRFALLGVVKEQPATFDLRFMCSQWETDNPRSSADILIDRGLLEPVGERPRFQMHALLVALARSMLE